MLFFLGLASFPEERNSVSFSKKRGPKKNIKISFGKNFSLCENFRSSMPRPTKPTPSSDILRSLGQYHSSLGKKHDKNVILATVAHIIPRKLLWECGWEFSKKTFTKVRKNEHLKPRLARKTALSATLKEQVEKFFHTTCLPSGGKKFMKKGLETQALFYDDTLVSMWKKFCSQNPSQKLSYSAFCKLRPQHCVRSQLRTDVCPKCKLLKALLRKTSNSEEEKVLIKPLLKHRESANVQREKFKGELEQLECHQTRGIVVIDFKENFRFWKSKEQDADSFRNNLTSTIFNASVFVFRNGSLQAHNWTFCSDNLTHDSFFVKHALNQAFETDEFKALGIHSISFWMDGGPHFRSHEINFVFSDFYRSKRFKEVSWNHFVEYHGKNYCDVHFSVVAHILKVIFALIEFFSFQVLNSLRKKKNKLKTLWAQFPR